MYKNKTFLAIIPARGGSKGIPRKNVVDICGRPLIAWTISEAKKSKYLDRIILSSDDREICAVARKWGCEVPFMRPKKLSRDDTPGITPVFHAIQTIPDKYDYIVLLQPTSPLRIVDDIDNCIKHCLAGGYPACVSVAEAESTPYWMFLLNRKGEMKPLIKNLKGISRRQDFPKAYALNGAVYVAERKWLIRKKSFTAKGASAYEMPPARSIDIDNYLDILKMKFFLSLGETARQYGG